MNIIKAYDEMRGEKKRYYIARKCALVIMGNWRGDKLN